MGTAMGGASRGNRKGGAGVGAGKLLPHAGVGVPPPVGDMVSADEEVEVHERAACLPPARKRHVLATAESSAYCRCVIEYRLGAPDLARVRFARSAMLELACSVQV